MRKNGAVFGVVPWNSQDEYWPKDRSHSGIPASVGLILLRGHHPRGPWAPRTRFGAMGPPAVNLIRHLRLFNPRPMRNPPVVLNPHLSYRGPLYSSDGLFYP